MPARERRWIVLADDGRHVTLGRATDPTEEEIRAAEAALVAQQIGGWLAVLEGAYYAKSRVSLLEVRQLGSPSCSWEAALGSFQKIRQAKAS